MSLVELDIGGPKDAASKHSPTACTAAGPELEAVCVVLRELLGAAEARAAATDRSLGTGSLRSSIGVSSFSPSGASSGIALGWSSSISPGADPAAERLRAVPAGSTS